jgi:hypothetical protein
MEKKKTVFYFRNEKTGECYKMRSKTVFLRVDPRKSAIFTSTFGSEERAAEVLADCVEISERFFELVEVHVRSVLDDRIAIEKKYSSASSWSWLAQGSGRIRSTSKIQAMRWLQEPKAATTGRIPEMIDEKIAFV